MSWADDAACLGEDTELFFPGPYDKEQTAVALAICAGCRVKKECLDESMDLLTHYDLGIRGGMTAQARKRERKRRALDRQSKMSRSRQPGVLPGRRPARSDQQDERRETHLRLVSSTEGVS
jgi:hypothetical protein